VTSSRYLVDVVRRYACAPNCMRSERTVLTSLPRVSGGRATLISAGRLIRRDHRHAGDDDGAPEGARCWCVGHGVFPGAIEKVRTQACTGSAVGALRKGCEEYLTLCGPIGCATRMDTDLRQISGAAVDHACVDLRSPAGVLDTRRIDCARHGSNTSTERARTASSSC